MAQKYCCCFCLIICNAHEQLNMSFKLDMIQKIS